MESPQRMRAQCRSLHILKTRLHDLNHGEATTLLLERQPVTVASSRLGHSSPGFTIATYQRRGAAAGGGGNALGRTLGSSTGPADAVDERFHLDDPVLRHRAEIVVVGANGDEVGPAR